jgi:hypothetical protein
MSWLSPTTVLPSHFRRVEGVAKRGACSTGAFQMFQVFFPRISDDALADKSKWEHTLE